MKMKNMFLVSVALSLIPLILLFVSIDCLVDDASWVCKYHLFSMLGKVIYTFHISLLAMGLYVAVNILTLLLTFVTCSLVFGFD